MADILKVLYDGDFKIQEITFENGETYEIGGYCCKCGKCCEDPNNNVGFNDETGRCSKLIYETINGEINQKCSIYGNRPISCMLWPTYQEEIDRYPECTLKFIKKT